MKFGQPGKFKDYDNNEEMISPLEWFTWQLRWDKTRGLEISWPRLAISYVKESTIFTIQRLTHSITVFLNYPSLIILLSSYVLPPLGRSFESPHRPPVRFMRAWPSGALAQPLAWELCGWKEWDGCLTGGPWRKEPSLGPLREGPEVRTSIDLPDLQHVTHITKPSVTKWQPSHLPNPMASPLGRCLEFHEKWW